VRPFRSPRRGAILDGSIAQCAAAFAGVIQLVECQLPKLMLGLAAFVTSPTS